MSAEPAPAPAPAVGVRRKGARRIAEIPRAVLRALNEGREETITLVEWLAIDDAKLLASVLPDAGFTAAQTRVAVEHADEVADLGIQERVKRIGAQLFISEATVATHVRNIMNKLGINSRAQIAGWMASAKQ